MSIHVKICCIKSVQEAEQAIAQGAHAIGLVGPMPSGPGVIDIQMIRDIAQSVGDAVKTFLLTSEVRAELIIEQHKIAQTSTIQLVDTLEALEIKKLRSALRDIELVQVLHVMSEATIDEAVRIASLVDMILLDSGNPNLAVKELGGTGRIHNWEISKKIVEAVDIPVYLAGGISVENVCEAMSTVQPYGIDLCSGVRTQDALDEGKLSRFFQQYNSCT